MLKSNRMLSGVLHFIPAIQILIVILHVALNIDKSYLVLTYLLIVVSMALGILNMLHFMSDHKLRQIETFLSDQSHEDVMIKKIRKAPVSNEEKMYQTFINMYFSCFTNQPTQQLLISLNWGTSLFVILYLVYPLVSLSNNGTATSLVFFGLFILGIFSLITYIYAVLLKSRVETQIIESHVYKKHLD